MAFVWRCLSGPAVTPFPHPAHRTGQEDFLQPALGHLRSRLVVLQPGQTNEPEVPVKMREWIGPAPAPPDFVLAAQPHRGIVVESAIRLLDCAYRKVVRPAA